MRVLQYNWQLMYAVNRKKKIDPKPAYQRSPVWSLERKQLLIDTIIRKYDIPKFYLRALPPGGSFDHEVADGQQRLRAIWDFWENKFPLGERSNDTTWGDLSGKYHRDLPADLIDELSAFNISVATVEDANDTEIRDLFLRLQEGVTLNPAERRNAMLGNMRDFVAELGEHRAFPLTAISGDRFGWQDLAAHVVRLDLAGGPADIKAPDLKKMYETEKGFKKEGPAAKRIKRRLEYVARTLKERPPEMNIKWGFVDLYLAISALDDLYDLKGREGEFASFYVGFEQERRKIDDAAELLKSNGGWERDLYDYIQAFEKAGGTKANVAIRHRVYLRKILEDMEDLQPLDPKRAFNEDERIVIWRLAQERCRDCQSPVKLEEMHADHIEPHSRGGKTTIENGQCLCGPCNLKKGAKPQAPTTPKARRRRRPS